MQQILPSELCLLANKLPFPLYVVGGTVRDFIAGLSPAARDWDICAPAPARAVWDIARTLGFELAANFDATGSLKLRCGGAGYEFTSFRTDSYSGVGHAPESVVFTDDIALDARRRDFTCNAVYYDICAGQFVDPLGGIGAIKGRVLIPCKPAGELFGEDSLRILRLCRFCGELGFAPADGCVRAAAEHAGGLSDISPSMVWREFEGILRADLKYGRTSGCAEGLDYLKKTGALAALFPKLNAMGEEAVERAICAARRAPAHLRAEAFLFPLGGDGVAEVLKKYGLSKARRRAAFRLICAAGSDEENIREFVAENYDILPDVCALRAAARADGREGEWLAAADEMKREGVPMSVSALAVRGDELIAAGVPPASVGAVLSYLHKICLCDPSLNQRERLIALAGQYCQF